MDNHSSYEKSPTSDRGVPRFHHEDRVFEEEKVPSFTPFMAHPFAAEDAEEEEAKEIVEPHMKSKRKVKNLNMSKDGGQYGLMASEPNTVMMSHQSLASGNRHQPEVQVQDQERERRRVSELRKRITDRTNAMMQKMGYQSEDPYFDSQNSNKPPASRSQRKIGHDPSFSRQGTDVVNDANQTREHQMDSFHEQDTINETGRPPKSHSLEPGLMLPEPARQTSKFGGGRYRASKDHRGSRSHDLRPKSSSPSSSKSASNPHCTIEQVHSANNSVNRTHGSYKKTFKRAATKARAITHITLRENNLSEISEFSFDARSMKDAKEIDQGLLEYLKKLDRERREGGFNNQILKKHSLVFGAVPTKQQLVVRKISKLMLKAKLRDKELGKPDRVAIRKYQKQFLSNEIEKFNEQDSSESESHNQSPSHDVMQGGGKIIRHYSSKQLNPALFFDHPMEKDSDHDDQEMVAETLHLHRTFDHAFGKVQDKQINIQRVLKPYQPIPKQHRTFFGMNPGYQQEMLSSQDREYLKRVQDLLIRKKIIKTPAGGIQLRKPRLTTETENSSDSSENSFEEMEKFAFVEVEQKDKWTISPMNIYYRIWEKWIVIVCLYTTLAYPFYTANTFPETDSTGMYLLVFFEGCFFIEMILNFFLQEFDEQMHSRRDSLETVSYRYLTGQFKVDLIAFLPLGLIMSTINEELEFFWVIKAMRISTLSYYLSNKFLVPIVKSYIEWGQRKNLEDEEKRELMDQDLTYVGLKIYLVNGVRLSRLIVQIMFIAYFVGQYWYVFAHVVFSAHIHNFLSARYTAADYAAANVTSLEDDHKFFMEMHPNEYASMNYFLIFQNGGDKTPHLHEETPFRKSLISTYFAFTTLSTVGFGDYYPVSNLERLFGAFVLLFGVALFSYIMGELLNMVTTIQNLNKDFEEDENLEKFFLLLRKFNSGKVIDLKLQSNINKFLNEKWRGDKNNFLLTEKDTDLFNQLPHSTKTAIFTQFLFKEFLWKFRRFFTFKKEAFDYSLFRRVVRSARHYSKNRHLYKNQSQVFDGEGNTLEVDFATEDRPRKSKSMGNPLRGRRLLGLQMAFYDYMDESYCEFMVEMMKTMEVRHFMSKEIIAYELDEATEIVFVMEGKYDLGYEINNEKMWRRQFGISTCIGGFQLSFRRRYLFLHRARTEMKGYAIRKQNWVVLMQNFPKFEKILKTKFFRFYFNQIYNPMMKRKNMDIKFFDSRKDYEQVLVIRHYKDSDIKQLLVSHLGEIYNNAKSLHSQEQELHVGQVKRLEKKFEKALKLAISITTKTETVWQGFWLGLKKKLKPMERRGRKEQAKEVHQEFFNLLLSYESQIRYFLSEAKTVEEYKFLRLLRHLEYVIAGEKRNPYSAIKAELKNRGIRTQALKEGLHFSVLRKMVGRSSLRHNLPGGCANTEDHLKALNDISSEEEEIAQKIIQTELKTHSMTDKLRRGLDKQKEADIQSYQKSQVKRVVREGVAEVYHDALSSKQDAFEATKQPAGSIETIGSPKLKANLNSRSRTLFEGQARSASSGEKTPFGGIQVRVMTEEIERDDPGEP